MAGQWNFDEHDNPKINEKRWRRMPATRRVSSVVQSSSGRWITATSADDDERPLNYANEMVLGQVQLLFLFNEVTPSGVKYNDRRLFLDVASSWQCRSGSNEIKLSSYLTTYLKWSQQFEVTWTCLSVKDTYLVKYKGLFTQIFFKRSKDFFKI